MADTATTDEGIFADRLPSAPEMSYQTGNTLLTYARGDLVIHPSTWGRAVLYVVGVAPGDRVACTLAGRGPSRYFPEPGWTEGAYVPTELVRVCPDTLDLDPFHRNEGE